MGWKRDEMSNVEGFEMVQKGRRSLKTKKKGLNATVTTNDN